MQEKIQGYSFFIAQPFSRKMKFALCVKLYNLVCTPCQMAALNGLVSLTAI